MIVVSGDRLPLQNGSIVTFYNTATQAVLYNRNFFRNGYTIVQFSGNSVMLIGGQIGTDFQMPYRLFWENGSSSYGYQFPITRLMPACIALDSSRILITGGFTQNLIR